MRNTTQPHSPSAPADFSRPFLERYERPAISVAAVLGFLLAWEAVVALGLAHPLFVSSPTRIFAAAVRLFAAGEIWRHAEASLVGFASGFGLAIILGVPTGILAGWYARVFAAVNPFVAALNATPRIALMPVIILWLGIGLWSKVAVVFLGAFFPIVLNMMTAMRTLDPYLLKAARSFGADDGQIFWTLALPASVPFLIAGLRLAAGRALVGVVVAEMYAANVGLGYLISLYGSTFQTDKLFVGILMITTLGVTVDSILRRLERRFAVWRASTW